MKRNLLLILLVILILVGIGTYRFFDYKQHEHELVIYGNVDVRQVDLGFRVSGRIINLPFQEGDFVPKGALVAELDSQPYEDQYLQAKAGVEASQVNLAHAEKLLERREDLIKDGSISQEDLDNALTSRDSYKVSLQQNKASLGVAKTNLNDTKIYAPNDGIILTRIREPGAVVKPADPVTTLSLTSPVWVRAFIPEPLLGDVYPGMRAEVFTDTKGGKVYQGFVGFISPVAEFTPKSVETTQLRTDLVFRLRIITENPDKGLRQGMPVTVKLYTEEKRK